MIYSGGGGGGSLSGRGTAAGVNEPVRCRCERSIGGECWYMQGGVVVARDLGGRFLLFGFSLFPPHDGESFLDHFLYWWGGVGVVPLFFVFFVRVSIFCGQTF